MLPRVNLLRTDETDYLMFSTDDSISQTIYRSGHWAKLILDMSATFLSGIEAPLVIDVGANLGAYAVPLDPRPNELDSDPAAPVARAGRVENHRRIDQFLARHANAFIFAGKFSQRHGRIDAHLGADAVIGRRIEF